MRDLYLSDLSQPSVRVGLTVEGLINELEESFPPTPPQKNESHEEMLWRGGQCSVVEWIKSRVNDQ